MINSPDSTMKHHPVIPDMPNSRILDTRYDHLLSEPCPEYLLQRLLSKKQFSSKAECDAHFSELMKYMYLNLKYGVPMAMTSKAVDTVWHEFILHLQDYLEFCREKMGRIFYHDPTHKHQENGKIDDLFIALYESEFGDLPEVWRSRKRAEHQ